MGIPEGGHLGGASLTLRAHLPSKYLQSLHCSEQAGEKPGRQRQLRALGGEQSLLAILRPRGIKSLILGAIKGAPVCAQPCPTLCDPMDCGPPGSSVQRISQARVLEWIAIACSRGPSISRDRTEFFSTSCTVTWIFATAPPGKLSQGESSW